MRPPRGSHFFTCIFSQLCSVITFLLERLHTSNQARSKTPEVESAKKQSKKFPRAFAPINFHHIFDMRLIYTLISLYLHCNSTTYPMTAIFRLVNLYNITFFYRILNAPYLRLFKSQMGRPSCHRPFCRPTFTLDFDMTKSYRNHLKIFSTRTNHILNIYQSGFVCAF